MSKPYNAVCFLIGTLTVVIGVICFLTVETTIPDQRIIHLFNAHQHEFRDAVTNFEAACPDNSLDLCTGQPLAPTLAALSKLTALGMQHAVRKLGQRPDGEVAFFYEITMGHTKALVYSLESKEVISTDTSEYMKNSKKQICFRKIAPNWYIEYER